MKDIVLSIVDSAKLNNFANRIFKKHTKHGEIMAIAFAAGEYVKGGKVKELPPVQVFHSIVPEETPTDNFINDAASSVQLACHNLSIDQPYFELGEIATYAFSIEDRTGYHGVVIACYLFTASMSEARFLHYVSQYIWEQLSCVPGCVDDALGIYHIYGGALGAPTYDVYYNAEDVVRQLSDASVSR